MNSLSLSAGLLKNKAVFVSSHSLFFVFEENETLKQRCPLFRSLSLFLSSRRVIRIVRRGREKRESCDDEFNSEFCLLRVDFSTEREKREKRKKEFEGCPLVVLVLVDLKFLFESKKKEKKRFDVFDFR